MPIEDKAEGRMDRLDSDMASREMDAQASRNGYTNNPNHSNARYMERSESEVKAAAFRSKEGYSEKNYAKKLKDQMNGMPIPMHMRGKDCP